MKEGFGFYDGPERTKNSGFKGSRELLEGNLGGLPRFE